MQCFLFRIISFLCYFFLIISESQANTSKKNIIDRNATTECPPVLHPWDPETTFWSFFSNVYLGASVNPLLSSSKYKENDFGFSGSNNQGRIGLGIFIGYKWILQSKSTQAKQINCEDLVLSLEADLDYDPSKATKKRIDTIGAQPASTYTLNTVQRYNTSLSLILSKRIGCNLHFFGRIGLNMATLSANLTVTPLAQNPNPLFFPPHINKGTKVWQPLFGAGFKYDLGPHISTRIEYNFYLPRKVDLSYQEHSIAIKRHLNQVKIGLSYNF